MLSAIGLIPTYDLKPYRMMMREILYHWIWFFRPCRKGRLYSACWSPGIL